LDIDGRKRVVIDSVSPEIDAGRFPIKHVIGGQVKVQASIIADGHDEIAALLLYRKAEESAWREAPMICRGNDLWEAAFTVKETGDYYYTLQAWVDHFQTWRKDLRKKVEAGQRVKVELAMGAAQIEAAARRASDSDRETLLDWAMTLKEGSEAARPISLALNEELARLMETLPDRSQATKYSKELRVVVERSKALMSTWYELFPRSCSPEPGRHGTFRDCERLLPDIARMGFDVLYLPPIHPIGVTNRKGKNNSPTAEPGDVGSPWAIGSARGGHKAIAPELGTLEDFERFVKRASSFGIEVALDLAYQASPDHPYVKQHPEWFKWRPDGTVQYAENPPKKYQDVLPFNFETENWRDLWEELKSVVLFWIDKGVRIFRVDNPHTKPIAFWEWLISEIRRDYPEVIFLAEAFTRPKVMSMLAKVGFSQSYTYFTWRNTRSELTDYMTELVETELRQYFRPNFWPNTPDILPEFLQYGGRPAFIIRLVLAATLSSNYGIYGAAYELCIDEALAGKEEYLNAEKYELKRWDWNQSGNLRDLIAWVNRIRRENAALHTTWNVKFCETDNEQLLAYMKADEDLTNLLLIVVNLDPFHTQSGRIRVPLEEMAIASGQPYLVRDLMSDDKYMWQGDWNFVELDPEAMPAHIFRVHRRMRREVDFDYFM
jgi:starch synthase (maltosyl-transferring)